VQSKNDGMTVFRSEKKVNIFKKVIFQNEFSSTIPDQNVNNEISRKKKSSNKFLKCSVFFLIAKIKCFNTFFNRQWCYEKTHFDTIQNVQRLLQ